MKPSALKTRLQTVWSLNPSAYAIEFEEQWITWGDLRKTAEEIDAALSAASIGTGEAIGVLLRNRPPIVAAMLGLLVTDRCVVSINPLHPPAVLSGELQQLKLKAVIGDQRDWEVREVQDAARSVGTLAIALNDIKSSVEVLPGLDRLTAAEYHKPMPGIALEILTSGTTGTPKRIRTLYRTVSDAVLSEAARTGKSEEVALKPSPTVVAAPLVHVSGIFGVLLPFCEGRPIVLLEKFTVDRWVDAVKRHKLKYAALPPTAMRMVLDANVPNDALNSLTAVRSGTAPLPPETQKRFEQKYGIPVLVQYGATEWAGGVAGWTINDHRQYAATKLGSVGRPSPGVQFRIVDPETNEELPTGKTGLLEVLATSRSASPEWTRTTDLASLDEDGFLYVHGRSDDVIIRGGFKIGITSVAEILMKHPAVLEASVVGLADERLGQIPVAAVELRPGVIRPTAADLKTFARQHLLPYQVPVHIKVLDSLPRTASLKVSRPAVLSLFDNC